MPAEIQEQYKNFGCYNFYLDNIYKGNVQNSVRAELKKKRYSTWLYHNVKQNVSFFQLLESCPDGRIGQQ